MTCFWSKNNLLISCRLSRPGFLSCSKASECHGRPGYSDVNEAGEEAANGAVWSSNVRPFQVFITDILHSFPPLSLHSHTNKLISADRCSRWLNLQYVCVDTRETRGYFSPRYLWLLEPDNLARLISGGAGGERVRGGLGELTAEIQSVPKLHRLRTSIICFYI